ncbi:hypothetical protein [Cesiribacter andamanensis]|uniref:Uncharacterized protein n=1 Tax=Cesiribacter andamanensis AMV16 TaxID=1279009 RepID=M7N647_9BACT|nr:hypothetical protein [Cesiribacter andamanensis]EMR04103.1 hypothetical protein ADICEAN_00726 [Cesiribacter andamanensis AMV16]
MQHSELEEAARLLQQHGVLEEQHQALLATASQQDFLDALHRQVAYLLERDMERLMQALYRIDIPDHKFREALLADSPSRQIAHMILERELLKVKTRRWYASRSTTPPAEQQDPIPVSGPLAEISLLEVPQA